MKAVNILDVSRDCYGYGKVPIAWVGGSGTWALDADERKFREVASKLIGQNEMLHCFTEVETPFGQVPVVWLFHINCVPVVRVPIHGWRFPIPTIQHTLATFWLLHELGIQQVIVDASVGGVQAAPWDLVIPNDVIVNDPAKWQIVSLAPAVGSHVWMRMDQPFCPRLGQMMAKSVEKYRQNKPEDLRGFGEVKKGGVYYTMPLAVFETPGEIQDLLWRDVTVVGQSSGQEAIAARYCRMCFAVINPVVNFAEGLESAKWSGEQRMEDLYDQLAIPMATIMFYTLQQMAEEITFQKEYRTCDCLSLANSVNLTKLTTQGTI